MQGCRKLHDAGVYFAETFPRVLPFLWSYSPMKRLVRKRTHSAEDTKQTLFLRESDNMTQLQPRPANPVDLTSMSFSFEWSLRRKIKLLTLHQVFVSQLKDQCLHISFFPIQIQIAFTDLAGASYFLSPFISPFPTLNLSPSSLQITWKAFFSELTSECWSYIMHWRTILSWFLSLWWWYPAEVFYCFV